MDPAPGPSAPILPPGGLFEMVFSFDTTGSMSRVIDEVKGRLQDMIQRLQADVPGIRFGVIAHGDYCDQDVFYLEKHLDLTTNIVELTDFVKDIEGTGGGDPEECYEYVLRLTRDFSWTPGSRKALVMIGDSVPHEPDYDLNVDNIDWREEIAELSKQGIKIYGVQVFEDEKCTEFLQEISSNTLGEHIKLGDFSNICDFIMAICYREAGDVFLDDYEAEVRAREARKGLHKDLEGLFGALRRGDSSASNKTALVRDSSNVSVSSGPHALAVPLRKISSLSSVASSNAKMAVVRPIARITAAAKPAKPQQKVKASRVLNAKQKAKVIQKARLNEKAAKTYRHQVTDKDFVLMQRNLDTRWSPWKLALAGDRSDINANWVQRKDNIGWRWEKLFPRKPCNGRALYEIAVQKHKGCRKHIMLSTWCTVPESCKNWEQKLIKTKLGKQCIQTVLKNGGRVSVRRFVKSKLGKVQSELLNSYNRNLYRQCAWRTGLDKPGSLSWAMDQS